MPEPGGNNIPFVADVLGPPIIILIAFVVLDWSKKPRLATTSCTLVEPPLVAVHTNEAREAAPVEVFGTVTLG